MEAHIIRLFAFFFISTAFVAFGQPMSKATDPDCDLCKTNVTKLGAFLMTDQVINATVVSFNRDLCPYMAPNNDTKGCQKNVTAVWPSMAKAIFSNTHLVPIKVCQNLNPAHCMNATKKYQMPTR